MSIGDKVWWSSPWTGKTLGVIIGEGRDMLGDYWKVRVTSRKNPFYPLGTIDYQSKTASFMHKRG